jgi:hypothetical protein
VDDAPVPEEVDRLRDEIDRVKAVLEDVRYNLALRAFTAPDEEFEIMFASLDARVRDALDGGKAT